MGDGSRDRGGDDVPTSSDTSADVRTLLEQAEAEAAEAEAAAVAARSRVREMPGEEEKKETPPADTPSQKIARLRFRIKRPRGSVVAKTVASVVIIGSLVVSGLIFWKHH